MEPTTVKTLVVMTATYIEARPFQILHPAVARSDHDDEHTFYHNSVCDRDRETLCRLLSAPRIEIFLDVMEHLKEQDPASLPCKRVQNPVVD